VLAEVAVYDPVKMRSDARGLKVVTEASTRLEKNLSPEFTVWALEFLADCLVRVCGGRIASTVFDYYPKQSRVAVQKITLDTDLPSKVAGVAISPVECERYLKRLGFAVSKSASKLVVTVPSWRLDVTDAWDVAEEIVRLKGFNTITPTIPAFPLVPDVTPARIRLADRFRVLLPTLGFDEILSLPMSTSKRNEASRWEDLEEVRTANAINEELPVLRQSLAYGLIDQQHEYLRKEIDLVRVFEIGKVFGKNGKRYVERERVGLLVQVPGSSPVESLQAVLEQTLRSFGAVRISYESLGKVPEVANPYAAWLVLVAGKTVGVLYQLKGLPLTGNKVVKHTAYAEVDLEFFLEQLSHERPRGAQELSGKLVVLDANIEVDEPGALEEKLQQVTRLVGKSNLWALSVVDEYVLGGQRMRYTLRLSYQNLTDADAKTLHDKAFSSL
jgi:phenylalanyl-tRNA synthetase beta chain